MLGMHISHVDLNISQGPIGICQECKREANIVIIEFKDKRRETCRTCAIRISEGVIRDWLTENGIYGNAERRIGAIWAGEHDCGYDSKNRTLVFNDSDLNNACA